MINSPTIDEAVSHAYQWFMSEPEHDYANNGVEFIMFSTDGDGEYGDCIALDISLLKKNEHVYTWYIELTKTTASLYNGSTYDLDISSIGDGTEEELFQYSTIHDDTHISYESIVILSKICQLLQHFED